MNPRRRTIAIAGNPNAGKTTLFNALTGSSQTVGNWPGVTVERISGRLLGTGEDVEVIDLPGIYSLSAHSQDEKVARDCLLSGTPELVVNVVDSTNLERNLYLTSQLCELGVPTVVVLGMRDLALKRGIKINVDGLSHSLGCPVVAVNALRRQDTALVIRTVRAMLSQPSMTVPSLPSFDSSLQQTFQRSLGLIQDCRIGWMGGSPLPVQWLAMHVLEADDDVSAALREQHPEVDAGLQELRKEVVGRGDDPEVLFAEVRYQRIHSLLQDCFRRGNESDTLTRRIDAFALHRLLGLPFFLLVMYMVFWCTINVGGVFIPFFDGLSGALFVDGLRNLLEAVGTPAVLVTVLADGVGAGIQALSTFIPVIFTLFLMLGLLEDSGYMARAAFVMDRLMRVLGLPGKAFVPLLVGFGCSVPAIMATRTLENRRDRVLTVLMAPFMSCGAKMPVYALFAVAFFPTAGENAVLLLYLTGGLVALGTGLLLKRSFLQGEPARFVMELPSYHSPSLRNILFHAWMRLKDFLFRAGKVLVVVMGLLGILNSISTNGEMGRIDPSTSILAAAGKAVSPIFEPFGVDRDNWPAGVSLFMGLFAKEIVVGSLTALYSQNAAAEEVAEEEGSWTDGLLDAFRTIPEGISGLWGSLLDPLGMSSAKEDVSQSEDSVFASLRIHFGGSTWAAFAFLVFVLLYVPCVSATATAAKEMGAGLTLFMVLYTTSLAWILATLVYQIGAGGSLGWILGAGGAGLVIALFILFRGSTLARIFGSSD